jgi:hypothetical protein
MNCWQPLEATTNVKLNGGVHVFLYYAAGAAGIRRTQQPAASHQIGRSSSRACRTDPQAAVLPCC